MVIDCVEYFLLYISQSTCSPPPHLSNNLIIELHFTIHLLHRHTGRVAPYLVIEITLVGQPSSSTTLFPFVG